MKTYKQIFRFQIWHFMVLCVLLVGLKIASIHKLFSLKGNWIGVSTDSWFWITIAIPIVHQIYVMLVWRFELYQRSFTKRMGLNTAFIMYAIIFMVLFVSRMIFVIVLAWSNRYTLPVPHMIAYVMGFILMVPVVYLFYSVKRYFTYRRALGIDHFDPQYNEPFEKRGIFKFSNNGMYVYGLIALYIPGLFLMSSAALWAAVFNHVYIWVHYFCTELPDMKVIYGKTSLDIET